MITAAARFTRKVDHPNIATSPTHERQETCMCLTNANFYSFWRTGIKQWNTQFGAVPHNYHLMYLLPEQFPIWLDIDLVLSQNKFGQLQYLAPIAQRLQIPLISMEHTLPVPHWRPIDIENVCKMRGNINIFIADFQLEAWNWKDRGDTFILRHCVENNLFKPGLQSRNNHILTVANDYIGRDMFLNFKQYQTVTEGLPVYPVGDTPGLSQAAKNVTELVNAYQTSRIFLNTAHWSPIPTSLLEAMSCGCACVSCATCAIPDYIKDGENGLLARNDKEMKEKLLLLLNDEELATQLGNNARNTILDKCSPERYIEDLNNIFKLGMSL